MLSIRLYHLFLILLGGFLTIQCVGPEYSQPELIEFSEEEIPINEEVQPPGQNEQNTGPYNPGENKLRRLSTQQLVNTLENSGWLNNVIQIYNLPEIPKSQGLNSLGSGVYSFSISETEFIQQQAEVFSQVLMTNENFILRKNEICSSFEPEGSPYLVDQQCMQNILLELSDLFWGAPMEIALADELASLYTENSLNIPEKAFNMVVSAIFQSPRFLFFIEEYNSDGYLTELSYINKISLLVWQERPTAFLKNKISELEGYYLENNTTNLDVLLNEILEHSKSERFVDEFFLDSTQLGAFTEKSTSLDDNIKAFMFTEVRMFLKKILWKKNLHLRHFVQSRNSYLNKELHDFYGFDLGFDLNENFSEVIIPHENQRYGILGKGAMLTLLSHPEQTSPTFRGKFIREMLLCQSAEDPPADVDTSPPEPDPTLPTMRDRIDVHLSEPSCASCHEFLDPIGLGLENFDHQGKFRTQENNVNIDVTGSFDGYEFNNPKELTDALVNHPRYYECFARQSFRYFFARQERTEEQKFIVDLADHLKQLDSNLKTMVKEIINSEGFYKPAIVGGENDE